MRSMTVGSRRSDRCTQPCAIAAGPAQDPRGPRPLSLRWWFQGIAFGTETCQYADLSVQLHLGEKEGSVITLNGGSVMSVGPFRPR